MKTSSTSLRLRLLGLCALGLGAIAAMQPPASADESFVRKTRPGREVLVRAFAEFDADCKLRNVQTVTVVEAPANGRIEQRPGVVTISDNGAGRKNCVGTRLDGLTVYYVPNAGFAGSDRFAFDVEDENHRTVRAQVDIAVDGGIGGVPGTDPKG